VPLTQLEDATNQDVKALQMKKEELSEDIRILQAAEQYKDILIQEKEQACKAYELFYSSGKPSTHVSCFECDSGVWDGWTF
jgi:hypothetical protein